MCGINLLIGNSSVGSGRLQLMQQRTAHRGPDHMGHFSQHLPGGQWLFAAAHRLATTGVGIEGANQPLLSASGRYLLLFNGQIYNHRELARIYLNGAVPPSDTQVLLALWEAGLFQGPGPYPALDGMWAYVVADLFEARLFYHLDPWLQKPLYASLLPNNEIMVCSEAAGITAAISGHSRCLIAELNQEIDRQAVHDLLVHKGASRHLLHPEIFRLSGFGELRPRQVMAREYKPVPAPEIPWQQKKGFQLEWLQTAKQAERPAGILFSAGVDSTLIALAAREAGQQLPAYFVTTGAVPDLVRKTARRARQDLVPVVITPEVVADNLDNWLLQMDSPVPDMAGFLTWQVSQLAASQEVRVLYSGAGADELFGGYNRHRAAALLWWAGRYGLFTPLRQLAKLRSGAHALTLEQAAKGSHRFTEKVWRKMTAVPGLQHQATGSDKPMSWQQALDDDLHRYLANDVLLITDLASMAASVEVRLPFMQRPVIDFALTHRRISWPLLHKPPLKKLLISHGLADVASQPKHGFGIDLAACLRHPALHSVHDTTRADAAAGRRLFSLVTAADFTEVDKQFSLGQNHLAQAVFNFVIINRWLMLHGY